MLILASDPGIGGALASYDTASGRLDVYDMPTLTRQLASKKLRQVVDELELIAFMVMMRDQGVATLYLELVGGRPGQSGAGSFNFGASVAAVRVAAKAAGLTVEEVTPAEWKRAMRAPVSKDGARLRATELLPAWKHLWPLKKHDGRAEAAMLALYGASKRGAAC